MTSQPSQRQPASPRSREPSASPGPGLVATRLSGLALLLFGLACLGTLPDLAGPGSIEARGSFWQALTRRGHVLRLEPGQSRFSLQPGSSLVLGGSDTPLDTLSVSLDPRGVQSSSVDLELCQWAGASYRLSLVPAPRLTAHLARLDSSGASVVLAHAERDQPAPRPFTLTLTRRGSRLEATLDGAPLLAAEDDTLAPGGATIWGDEIDLLTLTVAGRRDGAPFEARDDFAALADPSAGRTGPGRALLQALVLLLGAWLWLVTLSPGTTSPAARLCALAVLLCGPTMVLALDWVAPAAVAQLAGRLAISPGTFVLMLAGAMALPGLRSAVRLAPPRGHLRPALGLSLATLLALFAAHGLGQARRDADRPWLDAVAACLPELRPTQLTEPQPFVLDAGQVVVIDGPLRSLTLESEVTLAPRSVLELRLRDSGRTATGVSLLLSSHPGQPSGFWNTDDLSFEPIGEPGSTLPSDQPLAVTLVARGVELTARVDGAPFASARDEHHAAGNLVLLAPAGQASLRETHVEVIASEPAPPSEPERYGAGAAPMIALLLGLAGLLRVLGGRTWPGALAAAGFALLPLALAAGHATPTGRLPWLVFALACLGSALMSLAAMGTAARGGGLGLLLLSPLILAAPALAMVVAVGAPERADRFDGPDHFDLGLPHLDAELAFFQHPLLRRFNPRVRNHSFRERPFPLQRPDDGVRVLCVGSSSTWGFAIPPSSGGDWPQQLEQRLREHLAGQTVEVLNAGVPGITASRMLPLWRGDLARFAPDVVLLCFGYNDCSRLTELDEPALFERLVDPAHERDWLETLRGRAALRTGRLAWARLARAVDAGQGDATALWPGLAPDPAATTPPQRFARALDSWADAVGQAGARLILVREPARQPDSVPWLDELHAAMESVGTRRGLPVIDLQPALDAAGGPHLFMDAVHPLPAGNRVTASVLAPIVLDLLGER